MKNTRRLLAVSLACAIALAVAPSGAGADEHFAKGAVHATSPELPDSLPSVDGTVYAWTVATTTQHRQEIFWVDIAKQMMVTNLSESVEHRDYDQYDTAIAGDRIVYCERNPTDFEIRLRYFDVRTNEDHDLDQGNYYQLTPDIDGDRVVYAGNEGSNSGDIYTFTINGETPGARTTVANTATNERDPRVSNHRIAYVLDPDVGNDDVAVYDTMTGLTTKASDFGAPSGIVGTVDISGDRVVYDLTVAGGDPDIVLWDLKKATVEVLQDDAVPQFGPVIDGQRAYWIGNDGTGVIQGINFATGRTESVDPQSVYSSGSGTGGTTIAVSGESVCWDDGRLGKRDIHRRTRALTSDRLSGSDRYAAAVAIAREEYGEDQSPTGWLPMTHVVIASGEDKAAADPLAAAGLCWTYNAPLMLTAGGSLPISTKTALQQIQADNPAIKVIVVGGPASVTPAVMNQIGGIVGASDVERLLSTGGRYEMAAAVSARMRSERPNEIENAVFYANGADATKFFDALSLSALSRSAGIPILLVSADTVPSATIAETSLLAKNASDRGLGLMRFIGGGPNTVSEAARMQLGVSSNGRWYGPDRYSTSLSIAAHGTYLEYASLGRVALAAKVPDALAGGAFAGADRGVLLVTNGASLPGSVRDFLSANHSSMERCYLLGGTSSITPGVADAVDWALFR